MMMIKALTQISSRIGVVAATALFVTAVSGCLNFLPDKVWNEKATVFISSADFSTCVNRAVVRVPGVSVSSQKRLVGPSIELDIRFARPIPGVGATVEYVNNDTAAIYIGRRGAHQPDWAVSEVRPVVRSIAEAIERECGYHPPR